MNLINPYNCAIATTYSQCSYKNNTLHELARKLQYVLGRIIPLHAIVVKASLFYKLHIKPGIKESAKALWVSVYLLAGSFEDFRLLSRVRHSKCENKRSVIVTSTWLMKLLKSGKKLWINTIFNFIRNENPRMRQSEMTTLSNRARVFEWSRFSLNKPIDSVNIFRFQGIRSEEKHVFRAGLLPFDCFPGAPILRFSELITNSFYARGFSCCYHVTCAIL